METKQISELEQKVMNIVWKCKGCSVRDVVAEIQKEKPIAYTTILTILQRLHEKGLIIKKENGKAYTYLPKISKSSYSKSIAQLFLKKFFGSFGDVGIASFAESIESLSADEKKRLLKLLEQHEHLK